jgi:hypothetical protein
MESKIKVAPPELISYLTELNQKDGFNAVPEVVYPDPTLISDIKEALNSLPPEIQHLMNKKLIGIFPVMGLGSSGLTESVQNSKGKFSSGFLVLDIHYLNKNANHWITWRENTPFSAGYDIRLEAILENEPDNNRVQALQYILLHEIAHVMALDENFHPSWDLADSRSGDISTFSFSSLGWMRQKSQVIPKSKAFDESTRKKIKYYSTSPPLNIDQSPELYQKLNQSDFITLYGTTTQFEDFAECFTLYVHMEIQKKPFVIRLFQKDQALLEYTPDWSSPRFAAKKAFFSKLLSQSLPPKPE